MISLIRTDSTHLDFQALVRFLDKELSIRDGEDHSFYAQFNKINNIPYAVVAYQHETPVACGALRAFSPEAMEVKRMYVSEHLRGQGIASVVLEELEQWAKELGYQKCILETGKRQPEAIALYLKKGYRIIPNYGQYENIENSVCFEKPLG
ncbi:MAG: GNAT family N-acetyltransferase [Microscillaceae bacterium]|nr:GNAT family N-acetyltransferase [Microscillaceae bacterium]